MPTPFTGVADAVPQAVRSLDSAVGLLDRRVQPVERSREDDGVCFIGIQERVDGRGIVGGSTSSG